MAIVALGPPPEPGTAGPIALCYGLADARGATTKGGFDSCIDICYLVSCDGGCGISTGQTSD
ncbi:MAG TPA: hypothetical protein VIJ02_07320 [Thermoanaerobaculia bacterium]|jgi:hypothetical protein